MCEHEPKHDKKNGLCKKCYYAARYLAKRDEIRKQQLDYWNSLAPEEQRKRRKANFGRYRARHLKQERERFSAYYAANQETLAARSREWGKANPEKVRARCRKRRALK